MIERCYGAMLGMWWGFPRLWQDGLDASGEAALSFLGGPGLK